jgi:hypothetical protein
LLQKALRAIAELTATADAPREGGERERLLAEELKDQPRQPPGSFDRGDWTSFSRALLSGKRTGRASRAGVDRSRLESAVRLARPSQYDT